VAAWSVTGEQGNRGTGEHHKYRTVTCNQIYETCTRPHQNTTKIAAGVDSFM